MPANQSTVNILYAYDASNDAPIHRITIILLLADGGVSDNFFNEVLEQARNFNFSLHLCCCAKAVLNFKKWP